MLYDEESKILGFVCFAAAGLVGILAFRLPVNNTLLLFPILVGLFGVPSIIFKIKNRTELPDQKTSSSDSMPITLKLKSVVYGTFGGIASGFLPGVGTSEIAGISTINKDKKSFLVTLGAISAANIVLSFITIYLIEKARSGVAVAASEIIEIGFNEIILIIVVAFIAIALSSVVIMKLSKKILSQINNVDYSLINKIILASIFIMVYFFTGFYGIFLVVLCTALGMIVIMKNVKRGLLMGVLILPTILFFAGLG